MVFLSIALPPQLLKSRRISRRVDDSMLNVPVSEIVLNEPSVSALIGKSKAESMSKHVRMRR